MIKAKKKVYVGLSGGVDSAVSAFLLKKANYDVTGIFLKLFDSRISSSEEASRQVAKSLNIPWKLYDFRADFRREVTERWKSSLKDGSTPNPCVTCNPEIKFGALFKKAIADGADFLATGHYAKTINGRLFRPVDKKKDQTYFLHRLKSSVLKQTIFPLAEVLKSDARRLAQEEKIPSFSRPESNEICFLEGTSTEKYLINTIGVNPGTIIDVDSGEVVGKHDGHWFYTIGQRKGIQIGGVREPYFVVDKDAEKNTVFVGAGKMHIGLWKNDVFIKDFSLISESADWEDRTGLIDFAERLNAKKLSAMIRYQSSPVNVSLRVDASHELVQAIFEKPVYAPASGQSLVLYDDDECLGGGVICS